jgi:hypothetical protein
MALLIPTHRGPYEVVPAHGRRSFTLAEMQHYVGGHLEALRLPDGRIAWCNEDGKHLQLPVNETATGMLLLVLQPWDQLVGDVIITTPEEAGEDADGD